MKSTDILMKSPGYIVTGFTRNTNARGYKELEIDDIIQFSIRVRTNSRYSSDVIISCLNKGISWANNQGLFALNIGILELKEIDDGILL